MHGGKGRSDTRGERELCSQAQAVIPLPSEGGCVEAFKVALGAALHISGGEQKGTVKRTPPGGAVQVSRCYAQQAIAEMIHHPCLVLEVIEVMDPVRIKLIALRCRFSHRIGRRLMASRGVGDVRTAGCYLEEVEKVCGIGLDKI